MIEDLLKSKFVKNVTLWQHPNPAHTLCGRLGYSRLSLCQYVLGLGDLVRILISHWPGQIIKLGARDVAHCRIALEIELHLGIVALHRSTTFYISVNMRILYGQSPLHSQLTRIIHTPKIRKHKTKMLEKTWG